MRLRGACSPNGSDKSPVRAKGFEDLPAHDGRRRVAQRQPLGVEPAMGAPGCNSQFDLVEVNST
jgi:hypothetical protein